MTLRAATFSATRWTTVSTLFRAVAQLLQTAILARLLVPDDFGLMAMAGVALAVAALFVDLGLSSALMHYPLPDRRTLSTLYWLNLGMACLLALLFAASGWPLAAVYGEPALVGVLCWLSLSFPLGAIGQQFRVIAEKELHFMLVAQNEVVATLMGFAVAVACAWLLGMSVYALVAGQLVAVSMNSALAWLRLSQGMRPGRSFHWPQAKPFIAFGLHRIGDSFWNTVRMQSDIFIAGMFNSAHAVATYAVPRDQSLKLANAIINPVITRVGLPVLTHLQNDPAALRTVYLKILRLTASFNFPLYALLALFAEEVVFLLLGDQWEESAYFLRLFALWGLIRSTGNPSGSLLYAVGMAKLAHIWNFMLFICTAPLLWLAAKYGGLHALAVTMLGWQFCVLGLAWRFLILPACGASFLTYSTSIAPPLAATILATLASLAAVVPFSQPWQLPVGAATFSAAYLASSFFFNREWIDMLLELLNPLKRWIK